MGESLFANKSTRYVHLIFLQFLANLHGRYSWVEPIWHDCIDSYARHQNKVFVKLLDRQYCYKYELGNDFQYYRLYNTYMSMLINYTVELMVQGMLFQFNLY